jgi:energy-coupling factor transport system permease protein
VSAVFFIPFKKIKGGFVPILFFLTFTFISNLFYQSGLVVAVIGPVTVTDEGLRIAAVRSFRVFDMVYAAKILTHLTPLEAMLSSLKRVLRPLERAGLPVHEFFATMALTLQCFPVLKQKLYDRYSEKAKQRSVPESDGPQMKGILSKARPALALFASFMVPLFIESMADPEKFFMTGTAGDTKTPGDESSI